MTTVTYSAETQGGHQSHTCSGGECCESGTGPVVVFYLGTF